MTLLELFGTFFYIGLFTIGGGVVAITLMQQTIVSKGIISLKSDRGTSYRMYIAVQDQLTAAFNEMRNMKANEKWGKNFDDLTPEQQEAVKDVIPMLVSEAEPNVIKKK